jgi:MinD-like ATPase involved in chromosome partitioning or flagellar assembly
MTIFAIGSLHGSPGATTLALGLAAAWPTAVGRDRLVVEADPDGGVLAARFGSLRADRTLADLAASLTVRRSFTADRLFEHTRTVGETMPVLVAPPSADETHRALHTAGEMLAAGLASAGDLDALVDVGRITARSPAAPLARRAVVTVLVVRPTFEEVASLTARVGELRRTGIDPSLVVVGSRPYEPHEVADAAGLPLLGVIPEDPSAAAGVNGAPGTDRRLRRSIFWRSLHELASQLPRFAAPPVVPSPSPVTVEPPLEALAPEDDEAEVAIS